MTRLCFLDIETTGLNEDYHEIWEVAAETVSEDGKVISCIWHPHVTLFGADAKALEVNRYHERRDDFETEDHWQIARDLQLWTDEAVIVGANPYFDLRFVKRFMTRQRITPNWHYSPVDVKSMLAGKLGIAPPWRTDDLLEAAGIPYPDDRHTALGDIHLARAIYDYVMEQ